MNTTSTIDKIDLDESLLSRLKSGDEDAFRVIFTRWEKPLFDFIRRLTASGQDAEDVCQETFATLWLKRSTIDSTKNIKTFIFLIAKQITWKLLRSNRKTCDVSLENWDGDEYSSPESIVALRETELLVEYAIGKLPARTREIYRLYYIEDLSYDEIAARLAITSVNVKTQVYQARQKIKEMIAIAMFLILESV